MRDPAQLGESADPEQVSLSHCSEGSSHTGAWRPVSRPEDEKGPGLQITANQGLNGRN